MTHRLSLVPRQPREWLTRRQAAEHIGCGVSTLDEYRKRGLPWHGTPGLVRIDRVELDAWLESLRGAA